MAEILAAISTIGTIITNVRDILAWLKVEENKQLAQQWAAAWNLLKDAQTHEDRQKAAQAISDSIKSM